MTDIPEGGLRYKPAVGTIRRGYHRTIVSFDPETFAEIRTLAERQQISFAEQVRRLVEWGLMDTKDKDAPHG